MGIDELNLSNCNYSEVESKLKEVRTRELENGLIQHKMEICEDIIEYSLNLYQATNKIYNAKYISTGITVNEKDTWISRMYEKNCIYLISAYELCRYGFINPAYVVLRSVFEVVDQIYLMRLTGIESDLFLKMELKDQTPLSEADTKKIKHKYSYFSPSKVKKILYEENTKKLSDITEFYGLISKRAHACVNSSNSSFTVDQGMLDDTLIGILSLGIANLIAYWEVRFDIFNDNEIRKFDFILKKIRRDCDVIPFDIIPNKSNILASVKFKNLESIEKYFEA